MSPRGHHHPPYCACRFCQPPNRFKESHITTDLISVFGTTHSYTAPMTCSACGNAVFLYQSKHGGKAIFDELGPPWPKCLPKPKTVERVLMIEPYNGETAFIRVGCSLQGAVTREMLDVLRPDLPIKVP